MRPSAQRNVLERGHLAQQANVRRLADAAGHEDDDVGVFDFADLLRAERFKHAAYALRIVLVHLASERPDAERSVYQ